MVAQGGLWRGYIPEAMVVPIMPLPECVLGQTNIVFCLATDAWYGIIKFYKRGC